MIHIGTSGFSYDDWVGPYYPADLDKKDWLAFYAKEFKPLEINFTYYRMPNARRGRRARCRPIFFSPSRRRRR